MTRSWEDAALSDWYAIEPQASARENRLTALQLAIQMGLQGEAALEAARSIQEYLWPKETRMARNNPKKIRAKAAKKAAKTVAKKAKAPSR